MLCLLYGGRSDVTPKKKVLMFILCVLGCFAFHKLWDVLHVSSLFCHRFLCLENGLVQYMVLCAKEEEKKEEGYKVGMDIKIEGTAKWILKRNILLKCCAVVILRSLRLWLLILI
jgi:hypothetical protein